MMNGVLRDLVFVFLSLLVYELCILELEGEKMLGWELCSHFLGATTFTLEEISSWIWSFFNRHLHRKRAHFSG